MSVQQQRGHESSFMWNGFVKEYYELASYIAKAEEGNSLYTQLTSSVGKLDYQIEEDKAIINRCSSLYKLIKVNLQSKKDKSLQEYNSNIRITNAMIPDCDLGGVELKMFEKRAAVVNSDGQNINIREGGASRSVLGSLMRVTSIRALPDAVQFVLFDESFFSLSENTTIQMKEVLEELSHNVLIIGIEQRDQLFLGIPDLVIYNFTKSEDGHTIIQKRG